MRTICIDPGHPSYFEGTGKINWGAEENDIREVELNLELSNILSDGLKEEGFDVVMTRHDNETVVSNKKRLEIAKESNADLVLRIHADSERHGDDDVRGVRTLYPPRNAENISQESWEIASKIHRSVILETGLIDRGVCDERVCSLKNEFGMLVGSYWANEFDIPSVLIEVVYLSNTEDAEWISDEKNKLLYMKSVASGVVSYNQMN